MAKFKKGDRVRYIGGSACDIKIGTLCEIDEDDSTSPEYHTLEGNEHACYESEKCFERADTLRVGDVVEDSSGNQLKVLVCLNQGVAVYLLSKISQHDCTGAWWTLKELEDNGWKLKGTDTTVEKTVSDLERELKMQPGTLRIKKD